MIKNKTPPDGVADGVELFLCAVRPGDEPGGDT
jgi:hypothetical protein